MSPKVQDDDVVMSLVESALAKPPEDRFAYLEKACGAETELLTTVWNLVEWEARLSGFLSDPLYSLSDDQQVFEPGQLLEGRFRIVREVAQGGMGIVYEAVDEKLNRRIAVKCAKSGFRKRLPPEVRNASEISHPNVCKIFEIHTAKSDGVEVEFLTMEYLDGETLAERLRRGPLPADEALLIALQLCAAVGEAHRRRVIHGDLKSANVILTNDDAGNARAVVTDFGLARQGEGVARGLPSGPIGGTPDYMAPELWRGAKLSVASDIYALGVILREIGPQSWDKVVAKCVHSDPAQRFQSAEQVAREVAPRSRRWIQTSAAAALLAIMSAVGTYRTATAPAEHVRLSVAPLEGAAGATAGDEVARVLRQIRSSAKTRISVVGSDPTHLLRATMKDENGSIVLRATVTDVQSQVNARDWSATYKPSETKYIPTALAGVVSGTFHVPPLPQSGVVSPAARQDYELGLHYLRRNSTVERALPVLERAVASDPDTALTHAALAEARWWKYFISGDASWRARAEESVREAEKRTPDAPEVYAIAGLLKADRGRYEQAIADYTRAIELNPRNGDAYRRLAMAYNVESEHDKALAMFRRAIEVDGNQYRNYQALGHFFNTRANYREALTYLAKAVELAPYEPTAHFALATAQMSLGQYGEAEKQLREALSLGETSTALNTLGAVLLYLGREQEAIQYFSRALSRFPEQYLWWMNLGTAYRRLNLLTDAERANRRGLALAEADMAMNPRNGYVRSCVAYLCAWLGDRRRAESELAQALQLSPTDNDTRRMAVKTYEALGRREDSLAVLSTSPRDVLADLSRYPDTANLARDPRFQQMQGNAADR